MEALTVESALNRREVSKSETRRLILKAARRLFRTEGVERCTMREIAEAAGVSASSVVVHFRNKKALLEVALYEAIDRAVTKAVASLPVEADLPGRLMHIARSMFAFYDTDRTLYRHLIRDTVFEPAEDCPHISRQLDDFLRFVAGLIDEEKARGGLHPEADSRLAAASLFSLYFSILTAFLRTPEMTVPRAAAELGAMARHYITGIAAVRGAGS